MGLLATFQIRDAPAWEAYVEKNQEPYGRACVEYAARWAHLMEQVFGDTLPDDATFASVAKSASDMADTEGITGFMYGCAVIMLAECWAQGERLRRWHNRDVQLGTEGDEANEQGGVLNPALVNIAVASKPSQAQG